MSRTDTLRMPEHVVPVPHEDHRDLYHAHKGIICRAGVEPGYAHMNPDGTLHCNRCGYVTPESVITAYSPDTDRTYLTWDDLVSAESNGWVVIGTVSRPGTIPVVVGPFASKEEARAARGRLRSKWSRSERKVHGDGSTISTLVRPLWKENR